MKTVVWCDGRMCESGEVGLDLCDLGVSVGFGAFETLLAVGGKVFELDRHLKRLKEGMEAIGLPELPEMDFQSVCREVLEANTLCNERARVRITAQGTQSKAGNPFQPEGVRLLVIATNAPRLQGAAKVMTTGYARNEKSSLAGVKCVSYAESLVVYNEAQRRGYDEVLMPNVAGDLCEGATSNVFWVRDDVLYTSPLKSGCLPGVTREIVLELADEAGISVREDLFPVVRLEELEEVFLTSSLRGVQEVSQIDNRVLTGDGRLTRGLAQALEERICENTG